MAAKKSNEQVYEMVEKELRKNPDIDNADLYEKAKEIDKGIAKLSPRQFNARYPLQVKRKMATTSTNGDKTVKKKKETKKAKPAAKATTQETTPSTDGDESHRREAIRGYLIDLVREVATAGDKGEMVDVVAGIDSYVDRVLNAV